MSEKDTLIAEQQLRIKKLIKKVKRLKGAERKIEGVLYGCGGPLNDNRQGLSREQLKDFFSIALILKGRDPRP